MCDYSSTLNPAWITLVLGLLCGFVTQTAQSASIEPDAPLPRIAIMPTPNGAAFTIKSSGVPLLVEGFNYVTLRSNGQHATLDAATQTTGDYYDPQRAERMFAAMSVNGFNAVRVFITGYSWTTSPGISGDERTQGLYQPYMANVLDFLRRARRHGVYVLPILCELPLNRHYQSMHDPDHPKQRGGSITDEERNAIYFTKEGVATKARYVVDFINDIKAKEPGLLTTLLGVELDNEVCVYDNQWPYTIRRGSLEMPNGKSYNMADPAQRWDLMDEGLRYYFQIVRQAVKEADPDLLVAESVFTPEAVGKSGKRERGIRRERGRDDRYPPNLVSLGRDELDFLDIHYYRGNAKWRLAADFQLHMRSCLMTSPAMDQIRKNKPVILGEFGAFRSVERDYSEVVPNMVTIRDLALAAGMKGYLYWTYDTQEQKELYNAAEHGGTLIKALAAPTK